MGFIINPYRFVAGYDSDAQAFIDAVGSLTTTEEEAINDLVLDMKAASVWSKGHVYYPMVGGTASEHKWNLFDPRDLDAAFRLTFNGGWTHNADGANGNGTTGYGDTHLVPDTVLTANDTSVVYASGSAGNNGGYEMSFNDIYSTNEIGLRCRVSDRLYSYHYTTNGGGTYYTANTDADAVFIASRESSSSHKVYKDGTLQFTDSGSAGDMSTLTQELTIACLNYGTGFGQFGFSARVCQGAGVFDSLTATEAGDLSTAIDDFNSAISR